MEGLLVRGFLSDLSDESDRSDESDGADLSDGSFFGGVFFVILWVL